MFQGCLFQNLTPMDNQHCMNCTLFLDVCIPIADRFGYALGSECDQYFCESCTLECALMYEKFN